MSLEYRRRRFSLKLMLRRAVSALVIGTLLVAACSSDDDDHVDPAGTPDASAVDGASSPKDGSASATDANTPGRDGAPQSDSSVSDSSVSDADGAPADAGTDAPSTPPPDAGAGSFCQKYLDASYSSITTCCPDDLSSPLVLFLQGFSQLGIPQCADRISASVAKGRLTYDAAKEASCLAAVTTTSGECPAKGLGTPKKSAECELVYRGLVAEGGACDGDLECANGLPCQGKVCKKATIASGGDCSYPDGDADPGIFASRPRCIAGEDCIGGTCTPPAQEGDDCFFDDECANGLYCAGPGFPRTCEKIVQQDAGGSCDSDDFCKDGLTCHRVKPTDALGTCVARKNAGASCTDQTVNGTECAGYCDGATDNAPGTCHTFCGSN